ncbi:DUF2231 domain-containing protein [Henriciella sp.]|uniref:DUF2231 domain-containing protein n=1 Tax=Henriciella sp. TaxID=1968823 RepID=UPI00260CED24|nr:DUF2231 domain-containing protein [Henriciella sp.]
MENFIEPNIHPVLVHFTYALGISAALAYVGTLLLPGGRMRDSLRPAADWMLAFASIAVIATIAAGFQAYYSVAHDGPSHEAMTTHRNWAVPSGLALLALAAWRWIRRTSAPGALFALASIVVAGLLTVTAWWGGTIVYKYGLGVQSLPEASGPGHDHDHGDGAGHGDSQEASETDDHQDTDGTTAAGTADPEGHGGDGHDHDHGSADQSDETDEETDVPAGHDNSDGHHDAAPASPEEQAILDIIEAVETGWETGNGEPFRTYFLDWDGARYFESGGGNTGLDDLVENHVEPEKDAIPDLELGFSNIDVHFEDDGFAWAVADTTIQGTLAASGDQLDRRGKQTLLFRKIDKDWKVVHTHSSSRASRQ